MAGNDGAEAGTPREADEATRQGISVRTREEEFLAAYVGETPVLNGPILLVDYNPTWPQLYARAAAAARPHRMQARGHALVALPHATPAPCACNPSDRTGGRPMQTAMNRGARRPGPPGTYDAYV